MLTKLWKQENLNQLGAYKKRKVKTITVPNSKKYTKMANQVAEPVTKVVNLLRKWDVLSKVEVQF